VVSRKAGLVKMLHSCTDVRMGRLVWRTLLFRFLCIATVCGAYGLGHAAAKSGPSGGARYIKIEVLIDNSSSMEVGATPGDIAALMHLTPCSAPGAIQSETRFHGVSQSGQTYSAYQCADRRDGRRRDFGGLVCPIPAAKDVAAGTMMVPGFGGPNCLAEKVWASGQPQGSWTAGAPCAFACHWDRNHPIDASRDYFGLARRTIGQMPCYQAGAVSGSCAITLRIDLIKNAVARLINTMHEATVGGTARLSVGVFTFDEQLHAVYPVPGRCGAVSSPSCEAGEDWSLALGSVGTAPDLPNTADMGIQPAVAENGLVDTDLPDALSELARTYPKRSGDGATPETAVNVLFLITDGLDDHLERGSTRVLRAINPELCQKYKALGSDVYVLDTPYYPLMNGFYLHTISKIVEGKGPGTLAYSLAECASDPLWHFIAADPKDPASISNGLQRFLAEVLNGGA